MAIQVLVASRGQTGFDGVPSNVGVVWPIPVGLTIQAILWADHRYETVSTDPPLSFGPFRNYTLRLEIPGVGPGAPDMDICNAVVSPLMRSNGQRAVTVPINEAIPSPAEAGFAYTQISARWSLFQDEPSDKTGGLTQTQRLVVLI